MKSLEESVSISMDGEDTAIVEYLPYILQDVWEIGAMPETIIQLIKKHNLNKPNFKVLDLGCGKGAVSIKIAKEFGCNCLGIDGIGEFINEAKVKAEEYSVSDLCKFEKNDIRLRVKELKDFDVIILGSIGPVLGDYEETILTLKNCLTNDGVLIIDDGYLKDDEYDHHIMRKQSDILEEISRTEFRIIDEEIITEDEITESDNFIFEKIKKRNEELMKQHPSHKELFLNYIKAQEEENEVLEQQVVCSTMLIVRE